MRRRVLHRKQGSAAPFAAEPEALAEAQQAEQRRRYPAGARVGRQEGDGERRQAHDQQRGDERRLASESVTEVAENRRAERPREEGHRQAGIGREQLRGRRRGREEQRPEHQARGGRVDIEIVELARCADEARDQHARSRGAGIAADLRHPHLPRVAIGGAASRSSGATQAQAGATLLRVARRSP